MRRREFVTLLGGAALAWPCAARAQAGKPLNIGVLGADAIVWAPWMAAFLARLRELGWVRGHTIAIEHRWTEGSAARVSEIGADFLRQNVAVIVTYGGAVAVLKQATTVTPIVFAVAVDPVRGGLVASLARPGGNVTGMSIQQSDLVSKRLELLREVIPQFRRIAIMFDATIPVPCWRPATSRPRLARSASISCRSKSGGPRTFRQPSRRSKPKWTHFTSCPMRS